MRSGSAAQLILACAALAAPTWAAEPEWSLQHVEQACSFDQQRLANRSMAVGTGGTVWVAYGGSHLWVARKSGGSWTRELVDGVRAVDASIAVDSQGDPQVAYFDYDSYDLRHARRWCLLSHCSWFVTTVDSAGYVGAHPSIAFDIAGNAHIAYTSSGGLRHAWHDGSGWHTELVDSSSQVSGTTSIAVDPFGKVHVAYTYFREVSQYEFEWDVRYARKSGGSWSLEVLMIDALSAPDPSLVVDGAGWPHVVFSRSSLAQPGNEYVGTVRHLAYNGASWDPELLFMLAGVDAVSTSAAFDAAGLLHYSAWIGDSTGHLYYDGGIVATPADPEGFSSLAFDAGYPHLLWADDGGNGLFLSANTGSGWNSEVAAREGAVGYGASLATDSRGLPSVSYGDTAWDRVRYARRDGDSWAFTTVASDAGAPTALALTSTGMPRVAFRELSTGLPRFSSWGCALSLCFWGTPSTIDAGVDVTGLSLQLDDSGQAHVAYTDAAAGVVGYARLDGGSWVHHQVVNTGEVDERVSLALDASGQAHVAYFDATLQQLRYARRICANQLCGWSIESVIAATSCRDVSLVVDAAGYPHLAHLCRTPSYQHEVGYSYKNGTGWHHSVATTIEGDISHLSMGLDPAGRPNIAFFDDDISADLYTVRVAIRSCSGNLCIWNVETPGAGSWIGLEPALAIDFRGSIHVAYRALNSGDLDHAVGDWDVFADGFEVGTTGRWSLKVP